MTPDQITELIKVIGLLLTGGVGVAIIQWLSSKGKVKAEAAIDIQAYWHNEFKRLEERVKGLEDEVRGRDVSIAELKQENADLKRELKESRDEIERLTARIRELERLMKKYNIDPDCGDGT